MQPWPTGQLIYGVPPRVSTTPAVGFHRFASDWYWELRAGRATEDRGVLPVGALQPSAAVLQGPSAPGDHGRRDRPVPHPQADRAAPRRILDQQNDPAARPDPRPGDRTRAARPQPDVGEPAPPPRPSRPTARHPPRPCGPHRGAARRRGGARPRMRTMVTAPAARSSPCSCSPACGSASCSSSAGPTSTSTRPR